MGSLMFTAKITPESGQFTPTSFTELLHKPITLPGLDPTWEHTLVEIHVLDDGSAALLAVISHPPEVPQMRNALRVITGTPAAHVRIVDSAGLVLAEGRYPAPLQEGQEIAVGDTHYLVTAESFPGRDPVTGACVGTIDWQHVEISAPLPTTSLTPVPAEPPQEGIRA